MKRKFVTFLKRTFYQLDLFAVDPCLRHRQKPFAGSACLGVLSLVIIISFSAMLIDSIHLSFEKDSSKMQFT